MSVKQKELPTGSQLIMGLNPPFGVKASLANMFINKALQFKPKLLILIVPPETERLDKKRPPYDLIWEDDNELSGKSFYLPGSVDVNDKQIEQWNVNPPLLYLWSRQDWTTKHRAIAQKCGHVSRRRRVSHLEKIQNEEPVLDHPMADQTHSGHVSMMLDEHSVENHELEHEERREIVTAGRVESSPHSGVDREDHGKKLLNENSKQRHGKGKHEKRTENISDDKQIMTPVSEMCKGTSCTSSPRASDARSTVDIHQPEALKKSSPVEVGEEVYPHFQPGVPDSSLQRTGYGGSHASIPEDMARRYRLDSEEPFSSTIHRWSTGVSPGLDYGIRNSEEPFTSYMRGSIDNLGYRHSIRDRDEYGRNADIRSQVQSYGLHDPIGMSQRSNYLAGQDPRFGQMGSFPSTYGHPGSGAESSYSRMNTSAMQRYAPQLDELNHTRMNSLDMNGPCQLEITSMILLHPPDLDSKLIQWALLRAFITHFQSKTHLDVERYALLFDAGGLCFMQHKAIKEETGGRDMDGEIKSLIKAPLSSSHVLPLHHPPLEPLLRPSCWDHSLLPCLACQLQVYPLLLRPWPFIIPITPPKSVLRFISIACLPIKIKTVPSPKSHSVIYNYKRHLHPNVVLFLYCCHMYLALEIVQAMAAIPARAIPGFELEPQFNEPYLTTSLQDFWGRRWNLSVTNILRPTVYDPPHVGGHRLLCSSGLCTVSEVVGEEGIGGRWRLHRAVSGPLTIGFVCVTAAWLFFPQLLRNHIDERAIREYSILVDFVKQKFLTLPPPFMAHP
ncbi:Protein enhanced downy mildew 2 [Vitis vinifera]|uniref:Protein enhanced downy mildew 2 n=1 Tax=Vitis vinifera TaxID=29760 RepID=A0A438GDF1_VITVI|nr:Protein enhanced downy mildew 2 [Vitis vinifera]